MRSRESGGHPVVLSSAVFAVMLVAACDILVFAHHNRHWPHGFAVWLEGSVSLPIWLAIGLLIVSRVPGNWLGPIALSFAVLDGAQLFSGALATYLAGASPSGSTTVNFFAGASVMVEVAALGGLIVFAQLAPDGHPVSRRWWPVTAATCLGLSIAAVANLGSPAAVRDAVPVAHPPLGSVPPGLLRVLNASAAALVLVGVAATLAGALVRWRRGTGLQRQQLKVIAYAAFTAVVMFAVLQPITSAVWPHATLPGNILWTIIPSIVPASIAVAVLRYRLYDIDRLVTRSATYVVLTATLVGVYAGCIVLTTSLLSFGSSFGVATSTLAAAAAFRPVRNRVQRVVDRRFNRTGYNAEQIVGAFSRRLRDQVEVDAVSGDLLRTVGATVAPMMASVWVMP